MTKIMQFLKRLSYSLLLFYTAVLLFSCTPKMNPPVRVEMPFNKYGFERSTYNDGGFEFLMGNGEMGGRLHYNGLGFEKLWFSDYWSSPEKRASLPGVLLLNDTAQNQSPDQYRSYLDIDKALCTTDVVSTHLNYHAEIFFSFEDEHLIALRIVNRSSAALEFKVMIPHSDFALEMVGPEILAGRSDNPDHYNMAGWALRSSIPLSGGTGKPEIAIPPGKSAEIFYSVTTQYDHDEPQALALSTVKKFADFDAAFSAHDNAWKGIRSNIGSVILPDSDYARWFYRCIYTNYATAGSKRFLAAETQFAYPEVDWDMHAFTYGHGSWAALGFLHLGDSARARRSLKWLYQPEALKKNVKILIPDTGKLKLTYRGKEVKNAFYLRSYPENAFAFGHELTDFGQDIPYPNDAHWDLQFHVNGFASAMFHRFSRYYPDTTFERQITLPVVQGTAAFWSALLKKDSAHNGYNLPPMLSLSENIVQPSVLDAVLAAKWNLMVAGEYDRKYNKTSLQFSALAKQIHVPQNDSLYLEYLNDQQSREGGGYFGIRACAYLGFPLLEQLKFVDKEKARTTLELAWKRNNYGKGMISFISNWFALTDAYLGNGDEALSKSNNALALRDKTNTILYEAFAYRGDSVRARFNPYFLTGYSSFVLVPVSMMLQSYDNQIFFFPAVPTTWNNIAFYDLPAEGGYRVSGVYRSKDDFDIYIRKNNVLLKTLHNVKSIGLESL